MMAANWVNCASVEAFEDLMHVTEQTVVCCCLKNDLVQEAHPLGYSQVLLVSSLESLPD